MKRDNLFRIALITHSNGPKTLNKYISLLAKLAILESSESRFTVRAISKLIKKKFDLVFLDEEIVQALGNDDKQGFELVDKNYILKPEEIQNLKDTVCNTKTLDYFLSEFIKLFYINKTQLEKSKIRELVMQYIYYSFNAGKKSLSSLLNLTEENFISDEFKATNTEKEIINKFLDWDNSEKNECIYSIVSYCLDYGMLTSKKDIDDYKKIFEGIQFFLDSNIIFRLIGMNNLERQETIKHFVDKCKEVEIELCYTNITYKEIVHTLTGIVKYVKYLNNGDRPLAPSDLDKLGEYDNKDFYEAYYNWCKARNNRYDDYQAYYDFLLQKVNTSINEFTQVSIHDKEYSGSKDELVNLSNGLMDYKNQRNSQRPCTIESAKIDINNFLYIKNNQMSEINGIKKTKNFFISTDRRFYNWAISILPGVPTVFMPSEWLSIILKYTSRTDSDYNTFCKFMDLRLSRNENQKDRTIKIIQSINELTTDVDVKRKVIEQINSLTLQLSEDNFDSVDKIIIKKAFDIIVEEQRITSSQITNDKLEEKEKAHLKDLENLESKTKKEIEDTKMLTKIKAAKTIAEGIADKKMKKWVCLRKNIVATEVILGIVSFILIIIICKISFLEKSILTFCDSSKLLINNKYDFLILFSSGVALIIMFIMTLIINYMCSEKRRDEIILIEEEKNNKMLSNDNR